MIFLKILPVSMVIIVFSNSFVLGGRYHTIHKVSFKCKNKYFAVFDQLCLISLNNAQNNTLPILLYIF